MSRSPHIGVLCSRVRSEEKLLLRELVRRNLPHRIIDDREVIFDLGADRTRVPFADLDVVLERCVNHSRALYALGILEDQGIPCVNSSHVANICGNKLLTTQALLRNGLPSPRVKVAFTPESALQAIEKMGYPAILKPAVGSWGRLLSKVNDREAAEAILEHKEILGTYHHSIFYIQEFITKPGRDIRAFVVGTETVAAIYRTAGHWITNTSRGGIASNCPITPQMDDLCVRAAGAVGGGMVAVDLLEDPDRGLLVNEVNYTMEFRNSIEPTGVNIPARMIDHLCSVAREGRPLS